MADEKLLNMIDVDLRKVGGKETQLTEKDYDKVVSETCSFFKGYADILGRSLPQILKLHQKYVYAAEGRAGYLKAVSVFVVLRVSNISPPSDALRSKAVSAVSKFQSASRGTNFKAIETSLLEAEKALNAYRDDMDRFLKEMALSAKVTGATLQVGTSVGFAILGVLAASGLAAFAVPSTLALAISAGAVKAFDGQINLLARVALGEKEINPFEEIWKLNVDATVAAAIGAIGGKLDSKVVTNFIGRAAVTIARKISGGSAFNTKTIAPILERFLNGPGKDIFRTALEEVCKSIGKSMKEGKPPTSKDFETAFDSIVIAGLTGGFIRNLSDYQSQLQPELQKMLTGSMIPAQAQKIWGKSPPTAKEMAEIYAAVNKTVLEQAMSICNVHVIDTADGSVAGKTLVSDAQKVAAKDRNLQKAIDAAIEKELKKRKIGQK